MVVGEMGQAWEAMLIPNVNPSLFSSQLYTFNSQFSPQSAIMSQPTSHREGIEQKENQGSMWEK